MEFKNLSVLALLFCAFVGINGSKSEEEYWKSVWPNTSMPQKLSNMFLSDKGVSTHIKSQEEKQYWTIFFEHDLYPGKIMNLGIHKHSDIQSSNSTTHITDRTSQPFGVWIWFKKEKEIHILNNSCDTPSAIGEDKHCVLSLESMIDFAISKLGKNIKVMTSSFAQNQDKYAVEEVKKIGDKAVMCHKLNFDKVVFYCHMVNATTTYSVPLVASDGTKSEALTICHHDTRGMNPNVLYDVLKVKPGTNPVCHFIGNKAIAWVPDVSESNEHPCVI